MTRGASSLGLGLIILWILLVGAGAAIPTKPYFDSFSGTERMPWGSLLSAMLVISLCYTVPNMTFLGCITAVVGAIGRSARIDENVRRFVTDDLRTICVSGLIRGFFMVILILSGAVILTDQPFDNISVQQYLKLCGLVSALGFAVGYEPRLFVSMFHRLDQTFTSRGGGTPENVRADVPAESGPTPPSATAAVTPATKPGSSSSGSSGA